MSAAARSPEERLEGGCLCGAVRYRATGTSSDATLCHCRTCRRAAGAPAVAWVTLPAAGFSFLSGKPVSFRSSPNVVRTFCGTCGTPLTFAYADQPGVIDVTTCSLDDPGAHPPCDQTWTSHRLDWMGEAGSLPAFPGKRGSS